jgi:hypothetical protein
MTASQIKAQIEAQLKTQSANRLMVHAKGEGNMEGAAGVHIGTVDQIENGNYIKLAQEDSPNGEPRWIPMDWVESVDAKAIYLHKTAAEVEAELSDESPQEAATKKIEAERDPMSGAGIG